MKHWSAVAPLSLLAARKLRVLILQAAWGRSWRLSIKKINNLVINFSKFWFDAILIPIIISTQVFPTFLILDMTILNDKTVNQICLIVFHLKCLKAAINLIVWILRKKLYVLSTENDEKKQSHIYIFVKNKIK